MSNTREQLSIPTIGLHWLIAIGAIAAFAIGLSIESYARAARAPVISLHATVGLVVLSLAFVRTGLRVFTGFPPAVGQYSALEQWLSRLTHWALIAGMVILPVLGFGALAARGQPIVLFGSAVQFPALMSADRSLAHNLEEIHSTLAWVLVAVVVLHAAGALKHHIIDRDGTLRRMFGQRVPAAG